MWYSELEIDSIVFLTIFGPFQTVSAHFWVVLQTFFRFVGVVVLAASFSIDRAIDRASVRPSSVRPSSVRRPSVRFVFA